MQEKHEVCDLNEVEVRDNKLVVRVHVDMYEEEYQGTSRDEEYYKKADMGSKTIKISCSLDYVYLESEPDEVWEDSEANQFISTTQWDSIEVVDYETVEFRSNGDLYIASYDSSQLDKHLH